jgi:hypothetical protein
LPNIFKKYFIPDKSNDHQPHLLKKRAVLRILLVVFFIEALLLFQIFVVFTKTNFLASVLPNVLVDLANSDRQEQSLGVLKVNPLLEEAAKLKAQDMASKGYFSHTTPDGKTPWYWLDQVGYNYTSAGENLAVNFFDSQDIDSAWMNSASHRANILNNKFTEIGIATANGVYQGKDTIFVVQFFGRPASIVAAPAVKKEIVAQPAPAKAVASAPNPKSEVLGSSQNVSSQPAVQKEMFIDIGDNNKIATIEKQPATASAAPVVISQNQAGNQSSWLKKILSSQRSASNLIYSFLIIIVSLALFFKIFIRAKVRYPALIFNGFIILAVIISILYLNYYLFVAQAKIF